MIITHEGKVAFITGAGHGIGRATAVQLAADGAAIAAFDIRTEAALWIGHLDEVFRQLTVGQEQALR